jgi:flagellin
MISIQTNVDSLIAQHNLNLDNQFQSTTIQQLTSGYRINKSGDDAAGLAVANGLNSQISQLNQGVNNANNGVSQLQIVDGGLSNISTILNRLQTLATESASSTFTGNRSTLNQEYSGLLNEITRQATNINLAAGGAFNTLLSVFVGGGNNSTNSSVSIDLSGAQNAVDATSLGLVNTNVLGGGTGFLSNTQSLSGGVFLDGSSATENFLFNVNIGGVATTKTITVNGGTGGISGSDVLAQLNSQLGEDQLGITASIDGTGALEFSGSTPFNVSDVGTGTTVGTAATPTLLSSGAATSTTNTSNYLVPGATSYTDNTTASNGETLTFQSGGQTFNVNLTSTTGDTPADAIKAINAISSQYGIYAVANSAGTGIDFQSTATFTVAEAYTTNGGTAASSGVFATAGTTSATAPTSTATANADAAITAISSSIATLGLVQGVVGAGENTLNYAIGLAQSQIASFSSAESSIKDADVAAQAANLSKSQVLTQTAVAALAQANSEPQAVLKLLQG